jgi:hypothetical protein
MRMMVSRQGLWLWVEQHGNGSIVLHISKLELWQRQRILFVLKKLQLNPNGNRTWDPLNFTKSTMISPSHLHFHGIVFYKDNFTLTLKLHANSPKVRVPYTEIYMQLLFRKISLRFCDVLKFYAHCMLQTVKTTQFY